MKQQIYVFCVLIKPSSMIGKTLNHIMKELL